MNNHCVVTLTISMLRLSQKAFQIYSTLIAEVVQIANINIRHLKPKLDQFKIMLHESDIDNFGVCETFLNKL